MKGSLNIEAGVVALRKVRASEAVLAAPPSLQDEVDGILTMLQNLHEGRPPREQEHSRLSPMSQVVLKTCEDAYVVDVPPAQASAASEVVRLQGAHSIQHTFKLIEQTMATAPTTISLETLRPLRPFRWCLTRDEKMKVQEWVRIVASNSLTPSKKSLLGSADDHSLCIVSSSSAASAAPAATSKEQRQLTKKAAVQAQKLDTDREAILAFFKPKAGNKQA